jgi:hypothetical protein
MNDTIEAIKKELTVCYIAAHKTVPSAAIDGIAASVADAVPSITAENAHDIFRRAVQVEAVPTIPTLVTAARNYHAETYSQTSSLPLIENADPRAAWLPKSQMKRNINMMTAIKNLSAAISDREYMEYCKVHVTKTERRGDKEVAVYANLEAALAFDRPKKAMLKDLYKKYWRMLPIAKGYPADAQLNHGLIPPTVPQFRVMLEHEAKVNGYTA